MTIEQQTFAIIERYCDENDWETRPGFDNDFRIFRKKEICGFNVYTHLDYDEYAKSAIFSIYAIRNLLGKRWSFRHQIPLDMPSHVDMMMDVALENMKSAYNREVEAK